MNKVLITTSSFGQCGKKPLEILEENGFEFSLNPYKRKLTVEETISLAADYSWIIAGVESYNSTVIEKLTSLKCISRVGVGIDNIDAKAAEQREIKVLNTPNGPTAPVAELALGFALALLRKVCVMNSELKNGVWKKHHGSLLRDKTIGIIGFGRIGREFARLLKPFNVNILFFDPFIKEENIGNATNASFKETLTKSDIISLHLSWNDTTPLIGKEEFNLMKDTSLIINLARGGVVDEEALYRSLSAKKIGGAALDVYSQEPYKGKLTELENVILTPHVGSYAKEAKLQMEIDSVTNLLNYIRNK